MHGTVAPVLAQALSACGYAIVPWDRVGHPVDHPDAVRFFIRCEKPDVFCHLALGPPAWAEWAARACAETDVPFLYVGSGSVYSAAQTGPFAVADVPAPNDDYGRYKLECERRVQAAHPRAHVARIGWQIGNAPGGNQMVDWLDRVSRAHGRVEASARWFPACSFLADTAASLVHVVRSLPPGLYLLDGNPGMDFFQIANALNRLHGDPWKVTAVASPVQNHLMRDSRVPVVSIARRFSA